MYEQSIRSLGEFGAVPLLRDLQSDDSRQEPDRRVIASRILADTAAIWMVPELLKLAADDQAEVRLDSAKALGRLTGVKSRLTESEWTQDPIKWQSEVTARGSWWKAHSASCTPPPTNVNRSTPGKGQGQAQPELPFQQQMMLKARN